MWQLVQGWLVVVHVIIGTGVAHVEPRDQAVSRIRRHDERIVEIFHYAMAKSASFRDLVATIEMLDRIVYVEEGDCRPRSRAGCLHMMPSTRDAKNLLIRFDSRQAIRTAAAQLAHELYHALEIAREEAVTDQASLRRLFARIGERSCPADGDECWETRAAAAFESLVLRELSESRRH